MNSFAQEYKKLIGYTVIDVAVDDGEDVLMDFNEPAVALVLNDGKTEKLAWIMRDPEGNGVGFLDIVEIKNDHANGKV